MKELIAYCIRHMSNKDVIHSLFIEKEIAFKPSDSYEKLTQRFLKDSNKLSITDFTSRFRNEWIAAPIELHIQNLKSGHLKGHCWHGAMPSMLHLSMQNKVRDCIDGRMSIEELVCIGADIMRHEYFMVATHDLCETQIILDFPNVIPPIGNRSISDFVFKGIPYDLKVSTYPEGWEKTSGMSQEEKHLLCNALYAGADSERMRKQAEKTFSNWGLNRFYIMVSNQDCWLQEPEAMLDKLSLAVNKLREPMKIVVNGIGLLVQLIEL
jgi:hypothetical protein